ncbi:MAG: hypothetical protein FWD64_11345 [Acidobacteriaceae bacterium]|nr:hypothetical protein [Acidobacteriaceae bacterium]
MRATTRFLALLALCLLPSIRLTAQAIRLPANIIFSGASVYSESELLAFIGLKPGTVSTVAAVQAAAQKLSDTGLFADVQFQSEPRGLVFALKLMPESNLLPARFSNLVWWSNEELAKALETRVPLYHGLVPIAGNMQDAVMAALTAMLAEKNVQAKVSVIPVVPSLGATPTGYNFLIESPQVLVRSVAFTSASAAMQMQLEGVSKDAAGQPFDRDSTGLSITSRVTQLYRDAGYLDAAVANISRSAPEVTSGAINLDLTATIHEGEPYRISAFTWPGSDIISAEDFNKRVQLHAGDIASQSVIKSGLGIIGGAYYSKGYQDAKIQALATPDAANHQVAYNIRVVPGPQYRIKSVNAVGLDEQQLKDFNANWRLKPGEVYDVTYVNSFLLKNTAIKSLQGYSATYKALSDTNTHLVDLTVTFVKGGNLVKAAD